MDISLVLLDADAHHMAIMAVPKVWQRIHLPLICHTKVWEMNQKSVEGAWCGVAKVRSELNRP